MLVRDDDQVREVARAIAMAARHPVVVAIHSTIGADTAPSLAAELDAALRNSELDADQLREIVIFLTHYAGWPSGAKLSMQVERLIGAHGGEPHG